MRVLTEILARQLAAQSQLPVIVEAVETAACVTVAGPNVPDDDIQGTVYVLTYSEEQRMTCVTTYAALTDPAKYPQSKTIAPDQGKGYGPELLRPVNAVPMHRLLQVYAPEYLQTLHWRFKPHFPLSPSEAGTMAGHAYWSSTRKPADSAHIEFDYPEVRARVAERHNRINFYLSLLLIGSAVLAAGGILILARLYRQSVQSCRVYHPDLSAGNFLQENLVTKLDVARRLYFEQQQQLQEQLREQERLRQFRANCEADLRSVLSSLRDEQLRARVLELLATASPDLDQMKALWLEIQEQSGRKSPEQRLGVLVESIQPYCTEEEFDRCRTEVFETFASSGFKPARKLAIAMHDQFKGRAREIQELEDNEEREAS